MNTQVEYDNLTAYRESFLAERANLVAMDAVGQNGIRSAMVNQKIVTQNSQTFSILLKQGDITDQKRSRRCSIFAATNFLRSQMIRRLNLDTFELSQSYILFYDKLEKANYFLENILETLDEPINGRILAHLLKKPLDDAGQWSMFCNIINKYGIVPKNVMPDTASAGATKAMEEYITEKVREYACVMRQKYRQGESISQLRSMKHQMLQTVYNMLGICLGLPPEKFDFSIYDRTGKYISERHITPKQFFEKYVNVCLDDYICLINAPGEDTPYYKNYTVQYCGNMQEGKMPNYLNLPADIIKEAAIQQLKDGKPVWFGCDIDKRSYWDLGVLDVHLFDLEKFFNTEFRLNKAERILYGQSQMTHAMVLQGVNFDENGKPDRWYVENSSGKTKGRDGYFVMSDEWFSDYVFQIVVDKKYLSDSYTDILNCEPVVLPPWSPIGTMASSF